MIGWIITLLILAALAAVFGFSGLASAFAGIAQVLFFLLLAIVLVIVLAAIFTGHKLAQ
jgi:uncharacterized membrane protein YtjA (UPF0391 family)